MKKIKAFLRLKADVIIGITVGLAIGIPLLIYIEQRTTNYRAEQAAVVQVTPVGEGLAMQYAGRSSIVETANGTFIAKGAFQLIKGVQLEIREQRSGTRLLCEQGDDHCSELL